MREPRFVGAAEEIACCKRLLELYPWQRYHYRLGAFSRVPRKSPSLFRRQRMRWTEHTWTPMQLMTDEGRPLVEFDARWIKPMFGSGTLLFAGDIHIGGACWDQSANKMPIVFSHPLSLDRPTALAEAAGMSPDGPHSETVREAIERETISDDLLWYTEVRYRRALFSTQTRATDSMMQRNRRGIVLDGDRRVVGR